MAMATAEAMSHVGRKAGTLVVIVMKAKNLPNRQKIGKQDPYCIVRLSHTAERTKTDKRGGQSPFWDHETRFPIPLNAGPEYSTIKITVFSDDSKEPVLIGDASIDLKSVYKEGEFDEWVELSFKNRYAGEVYVEMTYYSEAPPPVPALPKDIQSRGLYSRDSSHNEGTKRLKRRPLPQQPDLGDIGPPPSRGFPRHLYDHLPPSTSHSNRPSTSESRHPYEHLPPSTSHSNRPSTSAFRHPYEQLPPSTSHSNRPSTSEFRHPYEQLPPSTSHSNRSSLPNPRYYPEEYNDPNNYQRPRQRSFAYERAHFDDFGPPPDEYSPYRPPDSPSLGRRRSEASLHIQYYQNRPPQETEMARYPGIGNIQNEPRMRPRTSLPLPAEVHSYPDRQRQVSIEAFEHLYRQPIRRDHLDEYYNAPPPEETIAPLHVREPSNHSVYDEPDEPLPVLPYTSPHRQLSPAPIQNPIQNYSPQLSQTPPQNYPPVPRPRRQSYSPHTPQQYPPRSYSPQLPNPRQYSPTPPPHRVQLTPSPSSRSSPSPRAALNGPSPHPSLKKPTPVRAIDYLPPSSYAPEHTPPSQRRALPTPPTANNSLSEYSTQPSPLAYRAPEVPAKIPLGMTEREYWQVNDLQEIVGDVRLHGLDDDHGWREMSKALPNVGQRRWERR